MEHMNKIILHLNLVFWLNVRKGKNIIFLL
jgi:hypothetical protein